MGAWGVKGLESDAGLDVVDFLEDHIPATKSLSLAEVIDWMREDGFFRDGDVDFLYDNSAMSLAELYLDFSEQGFLDYDNEEEEKSLRGITAFTADSASLGYLLRHLQDIRDEVPDADGEREIVELWRDSASWEEWRAHLLRLITQLETLVGE